MIVVRTNDGHAAAPEVGARPALEGRHRLFVERPDAAIDIGRGEGRYDGFVQLFPLRRKILRDALHAAEGVEAAIQELFEEIVGREGVSQASVSIEIEVFFDGLDAPFKGAERRVVPGRCPSNVNGSARGICLGKWRVSIGHRELRAGDFPQVLGQFGGGGQLVGGGRVRLMTMR